LIERVAAWLAEQQVSTEATVDITHASMIRAAIVGAIEAEPLSFWRIDIAPLFLAKLSGDRGRRGLVSISPLKSGAVPSVNTYRLPMD
jgi:broad specificity phosphatase PhoE